MKYLTIHPDHTQAQKRFPTYQLWFTNQEETRAFPLACLYSTHLLPRENTVTFIFTRTAVVVAGAGLRDLLLAVEAGAVTEITQPSVLEPATERPANAPWQIASVCFEARGER